MKRKYSIIIIPPDHDKPPRQIHFSVRLKKAITTGSIAFGLFFSGLMIHDVYQANYIKTYRQKSAYMDELELELKTKDMEIARLHEKSADINNKLIAMASLESQITSILNIPKEPAATAEISRGGFSLQSITPPESLDQVAAMVESEMKVIEEYHGATLEYEDKANHTPTFLPVNGPISSPFGYRRNPFGGWSSEFHNGIDIASSYGTPVKATAHGTVTYAGWDGYWGRRVEINHGYGTVTFYAHNSRIAVNVGQTVEKGDIIAYSGNTGRSTGSHLHYSAFIDGKLVDPLIFTTQTKEQ